jgi:hypothetical protein
MTPKETAHFWRQCEEARTSKLEQGKSSDEAHEAAKSMWNQWASSMLARRRELENSSDVIMEQRRAYAGYIAAETFGMNTLTSEWLQAARADFSGFVFETKPNFGGFIFPGQAWFGESAAARRERKSRQVAILNAGARFSEAVFHLDAVFDRVEFVQVAGFRDAEFRGIARFDECGFKDAAWFLRTKFLDEVWFGQSEFQGFTNFSSALFKSYVSFSAARCEGAFNLNEAIFEKTPDFTQTSFREAPRLDNVSLPSVGFFPCLKKKTAVDAQALYRAIRRLAISSHDYDAELKAFKGEIRAQRGAIERPWHFGFWLGVIYDALSDFGNSMTRPLSAWLVSVPAFALAYLVHADKLNSLSAECANKGANGSSVWESALAIAVKNAFVLAGVDRRLDEQYVCLYGTAVPAATVFLQTAQTVCSVVLIFLFLLAVRNRFRIK